LTYTDFVNQYRINYSKQLLLQDLSISAICYESGFENLSYFNRVFKKQVGMSPSQFKKQGSLDH
jgi:AraC-like DNA-binding protein